MPPNLPLTGLTAAQQTVDESARHTLAAPEAEKLKHVRRHCSPVDRLWRLVARIPPRRVRSRQRLPRSANDWRVDYDT
jgi:hypothetical protein